VSGKRKKSANVLELSEIIFSVLIGQFLPGLNHYFHSESQKWLCDDQRQ